MYDGRVRGREGGDSDREWMNEVRFDEMREEGGGRGCDDIEWMIERECRERRRRRGGGDGGRGGGRGGRGVV